MGIEHETKPFFGIQYHPESISTEFGNEVIAKFLELAEEFNKKKYEDLKLPVNTSAGNKAKPQSLIVDYKISDLNSSTDIIFYNLFSESKYSFWLDTSKIIKDYSRFSIMGSVEANHDKAILFERNAKELSVVKDGKTSTYKKDLFEYLSEEIDKNYVKPVEELPFNFNAV